MQLLVPVCEYTQLSRLHLQAVQAEPPPPPEKACEPLEAGAGFARWEAAPGAGAEVPPRYARLGSPQSSCGRLLAGCPAWASPVPWEVAGDGAHWPISPEL